MVVYIFPLAKLGALLVRQISKPITLMLTKGAVNSPFFRKYVVLPPAKAFHFVELKSKMWVLKMGKPVNIAVLNEEALVDLGAGILSEFLIFSIAAGLLINEYYRAAKKEAAKEAKKVREMNELRDVIRDLFFQNEVQQASIKHLTRQINDLESRVVLKPWKPSTPDVEEPETEPPREPPPSLERVPLEQSIIELIQEPPEEPPSSKSPSEEPPNVERSTDETKVKELVELDKLRKKSKMTKSEISYGNGNLILTALGNLESQFLFDTNGEREDGILTTALNLLYRDVYKIPIRF